MDVIVPVLIRLVALCAFSALTELLLSSGKLLSGVRLISGLLVVETAAELLMSAIGLLRIL